MRIEKGISADGVVKTISVSHAAVALKKPQNRVIDLEKRQK
jgi:hypothetical protein